MCDGHQPDTIAIDQVVLKLYLCRTLSFFQCQRGEPITLKFGLCNCISPMNYLPHILVPQACLTPFMHPCCSFSADQYTALMSGDSLSPAPQPAEINKKQYPSISTSSKPICFFLFTSGGCLSVNQ